MNGRLLLVLATAGLLCTQPAEADCVQLHTKYGTWYAFNGCGQTITIRVWKNGRDYGLVNAPAGLDATLPAAASENVSYRWCPGFGCNP